MTSDHPHLDHLALAPVIPVVVHDDPTTAPDLARALLAGGIPIIELTLRTPSALDCVRAIAEEVPQMLLGVGTVLTAADVERAGAAGAGFLVSPGSTEGVLAASRHAGLPILPGVATPTEAMRLADDGWTDLKFFPAEAAGGVPFLRALAAPLPGIRFCPTGGITPATAVDYLALPHVACVGGSWITPAGALAAREWARVESLAREAAALRA